VYLLQSLAVLFFFPPSCRGDSTHDNPSFSIRPFFIGHAGEALLGFGVGASPPVGPFFPFRSSIGRLMAFLPPKSFFSQTPFFFSSVKLPHLWVSPSRKDRTFASAFLFSSGSP